MLTPYERKINFSLWTQYLKTYIKFPFSQKFIYELLKWDKYTIDKAWKTNSTSRETNKPLETGDLFNHHIHHLQGSTFPLNKNRILN